MSVARLRLTPVGETMFLSRGYAAHPRAPAADDLAATGFPPRTPFFQRPMLARGTSRFPSNPSPAHRLEGSR
jgi:hypothetical protein